MKHSVDATHKKEIPNLLSNSNRNNSPTINILSSLENRKNVKKSNKFGRKKMWTAAFFTAAVIGIAGFLQFGNLQILAVNNDQAPSQNSKPDRSAKPLVNINLQSEVKASTKPVEPLIVDDVNTTLESSAILVELPSYNEKIAVSRETLSNTDQQKALASDSKESSPTSRTTISSTSQKPSTKTPSHNMEAKKQGIAKQDDIEKKNKDPLKIHQSTEKNSPKTYDSDIALLSALVANTAKSRDDLSGNMNRPTSKKKPMTTAINLDVVERNPSDNTRNLLARCEKLGGMEAKLCHDRICSGSWQLESACSPSKG